jgi:hypothetical protein
MFTHILSIYCYTDTYTWKTNTCNRQVILHELRWLDGKEQFNLVVQLSQEVHSLNLTQETGNPEFSRLLLFGEKLG